MSYQSRHSGEKIDAAVDQLAIIVETATAIATVVESAAAKVATLQALRDLPNGAITDIYVQARETIGDGGEGYFHFYDTDLSANPAIIDDSQSGVWVTRTGDAADGSDGAWKRVYSGALPARVFGVNQTAITAAIDAVGYGYITGAFTCNTATFDGPLIFDYGAYLDVAAGQTVTITSSIESVRQYVFRGDGAYVLTSDSDSGENARQIHVSLFGAFPTVEVDQAPMMNKAFASMGNARESVVEFDIGNYHVNAETVVTRGGHVKGTGSRRTVFKPLSDGFDVFRTSGEACRFSGIQFEHPTQATTIRASAWISIDHNNCEILDVFGGRAFRSFLIKGNNCQIENIGAFYDLAAGAGSSLIAVQATGTQIRNIKANTSTSFGPTYLVHVGAALGGSTTTVSGVTITGINTSTPAMPVFFDASAMYISRCRVNGVDFNAFQGAAPEAVVKLLSAATFNVEDIGITNITSNSYATNGILLEQNSSGTMSDVSIDNTIISGTTGIGIGFTRTAGTLKEVTIGSNVDVSERATPYSYTGTVSAFKISPNALPNVQNAYCYDFTIPDDSVATIDLRRSVFAGMLMVNAGYANYGIYSIRAAAGPAVAAVSASANMATATTALTGTTGTDAKFTVGITDGVLYFENRLGSSQRVSVALLTAIP